jgi:hypothetical protein
VFGERGAVAEGERALERKAVRSKIGIGVKAGLLLDRTVEPQGRQRDETSSQGAGQSKPSRG